MHLKRINEKYRSVQQMDYSGASLVVDLIEGGAKLHNIVDRWGRAKCPEATQFVQHHKQVKRMMIKDAIENQQFRDWLREKEASQESRGGAQGET